MYMYRYIYLYVYIHIDIYMYICIRQDSEFTLYPNEKRLLVVLENVMVT